ncbi:MAG: DUF4476 domain-containing protein [Bacteroidia bacterium]|nr:DUF4476 domain-containing protein [Bacteroidia bacterium]MCX7652965.1 DUF4476 domain-containing protein [Bacteroidia bacterium]MDW8417472.1 DUF4476 domain-containing protein [Bacteroidia bacterium]
MRGIGLILGLGILWGQSCLVGSMSEVEFNYFRLEVSSQSIESSRIALLRSVLPEHCISTAQLRDLLWTLDHESSRIEVLRFAADRVYNPKLLHEELLPLFTTESGRREFERWWEKWQKSRGKK